MASSVVQVFNQACSAIGTRARIASPTEASREAEVCQDWYETVRDRILQMAPWPEASGVARLAVHAERDTNDDWIPGDPEPGFLFSYILPSDYLHPRYLAGYGSFQMGYSGDELRLNTQGESVILHYTRRQEDPSKWGPQLSLAIVYSLAAFIAVPLHGKTGRGERMIAQANQLALEARQTAANTANYTLDSMPDWITARGYSDNYTSPRFYYPPMPLFSLTDLPAVV